MRVPVKIHLATVFTTLAFPSCGSPEVGTQSSELVQEMIEGVLDLCHRTSNARRPYVPKQVPTSAIPAHLRHGDHLAGDDLPEACGVSCTACNEGEVCADGTCELRPTCDLNAPGLDGHYEGFATITVERYPGSDWPVCSSTSTTVSASVILDVITAPAIAVAIQFPGFVPIADQIELDLDLAEGTWVMSPDGSTIVSNQMCRDEIYADPGLMTLTIDPAPGSVSFDVRCSRGHLDDCQHPDNWLTVYSMMLSRVCLAP